MPKHKGEAAEDQVQRVAQQTSKEHCPSDPSFQRFDFFPIASAGHIGKRLRQIFSRSPLQKLRKRTRLLSSSFLNKLQILLFDDTVLDQVFEEQNASFTDSLGNVELSVSPFYWR